MWTRVKNILLISYIMMIAGCKSIKSLQESGSVSPENFHTTLKFKSYKSVIALDVEIEDEVKQFLFDTGADLTILQREEIKGRTSKFTGASKRKMKLAWEVVPFLGIQDVEFQNTYALGGDLIGLKEQIPNFGGILGQSVISKANWLINYPKQTISFSDERLIDSTFVKLNTFIYDGSPFTYMKYKGKEYKVMIDLGSSSVLNMPKESQLAREVAKNVQTHHEMRDRYTLGGLQHITEEVGLIPQLSIDNMHFNDIRFNINESSHIRIGNLFFGDGILYIDNDTGAYYFKKLGI